MTKVKDYIRGDTRIFQLNCVQSDKTTPINLTGGTVYFTVNSSGDPADDTSKLFQKTVTTFTAPVAGTTLNGTAFAAGQDTGALGVAWPKVLPTDTQTLAAGDYYYDAQVLDALGNKTSLPQDVFTINADITRS